MSAHLREISTGSFLYRFISIDQFPNLEIMTEKADSKNLGHHFYDSRELPPPTYIDAANRGALASNATPYPPQPHHTQAICRTMHFMYGKWGANCVSVLADDRTTELYTMKLRMRKPNLTVESAFTHDTIGSVNYKMMKASMDSFVRGNPIPLTAHGILCAKYTWASPSLGGRHYPASDSTF